MQQLDLFDTVFSNESDTKITMSPLQLEIMQSIATGDEQRATELLVLQNDSDDDDIWF